MSDALCATYSVYIQDRRTRKPKPGCDLSALPMDGKWRREYKQKSTADITIYGLGGCCDCDIDPWVDELVIERHGDEDTRPWIGPISETIEDRAAGTLTISACDRSGWWDRRQLLHQPMFFDGADAVDVWAAVRADQDSVGPSGLRVTPTGPVDVRVDVDAERFDTTAEVLAFLNDVAWAVVGDRLYGPGATTTGDAPFITLDSAVDWVNADGRSGPVIVNDGTSTTTKVYVLGANGKVGVYPPDGSPEPANGWHVPQPIQAPGLDNIRELTDIAREVYDRNRNGSLFLASSSGSLRKNSPVCVADLIPGRRFGAEISGTCRDDFIQTMELSRVVVDFGWEVAAGSAAIRERRVAVDFAPVGVDYDAQRLSV